MQQISRLGYPRAAGCLQQVPAQVNPVLPVLNLCTPFPQQPLKTFPLVYKDLMCVGGCRQVRKVFLVIFVVSRQAELCYSYKYLEIVVATKVGHVCVLSVVRLYLTPRVASNRNISSLRTGKREGKQQTSSSNLMLGSNVYHEHFPARASHVHGQVRWPRGWGKFNPPQSRIADIFLNNNIVYHVLTIFL